MTSLIQFDQTTSRYIRVATAAMIWIIAESIKEQVKNGGDIFLERRFPYKGIEQILKEYKIYPPSGGGINDRFGCQKKVVNFALSSKLITKGGAKNDPTFSIVKVPSDKLDNGEKVARLLQIQDVEKISYEFLKEQLHI